MYVLKLKFRNYGDTFVTAITIDIYKINTIACVTYVTLFILLRPNLIEVLIYSPKVYIQIVFHMHLNHHCFLYIVRLQLRQY